MNSLSYLLLTTLKNRLLSLRKKPVLLILYLFVTVSVVLMLILFTKGNTVTNRHVADIRILYAILAGVGLLFLFSLVTTGISTGSTIFNMSDVGLLFVSPISSKKILIYGLIKQMGTTMLTAIFIFYQIGTLKQNFGLNGFIIIYLFIIYAVILFYCQLLSIAVYVFTNGKPKHKLLVKGILYGIIALIVLMVFLFQIRNGGSIYNNLLKTMDFKSFYLIPVAGWSVMFLKGAIEGSVIYILISFLLFLLSGIVIVMFFTRDDADYYEDVLASTEILYNRLQAAKEGKRTVNTKKMKIKEEQTGINNGKSSLAIFYKHLLEKKRTSRFIFIDTYTIFATVGAAIFCKYFNKDYSVYIVSGILIYFQFFLSTLGKFNMELTKPFIYLIPDKSIKKILAASGTSLIKPCIDAVFIYTAVCIFSRTSPLLNLFLALAYASSGAIFVSFTILCQRTFEGQLNKLICSLLELVLFIIVIGPGVGASAAAIILLPKQFFFLFSLPFTFCCVVITVFVFILCGDLLDKAEYSGK